MANTPVSDDELQLKKKARRRLVGAVVLVLLVVVFVPMFLDRGPRPKSQDIDIKIPPIPGQPQPQQAPAAAPVPEPAPPLGAAASDNSTAVPASAAAEAVAAKDATAPPEASQTAANETTQKEPKGSESFVIQIGAFSDPANARHLVEKLKAEKIPAYTEPVKSAQGEKTRVRAGPYPTIAAAEQARTRLKQLKLVSGDAKIVHKGE